MSAKSSRRPADHSRGSKNAQHQAPSTKPSIAVLPFENMSGDAEQEYFSDGISEDITTDLSKLSGLLVVARNSAFAYKGKPANVTDITRELGVRYLLEGSVRKSGQRVRINAQLIDGDTGGHVWAERYDRELTDIFAVQDEVTQAIVTALAPTLTGSERRLLEPRETRDIEAYDYYLRGRELALRDIEDCTAQRGPCWRKRSNWIRNFPPPIRIWRAVTRSLISTDGVTRRGALSPKPSNWAARLRR